MTAVGSLESVSLRMASAAKGESGGNHIKQFDRRYEILSLVGTLTDSAKHLHLCISDAEGSTIGGHLMGGRIFTTLELVLGTVENVAFDRRMDARTGYRELCVSPCKTGAESKEENLEPPLKETAPIASQTPVEVRKAQQDYTTTAHKRSAELVVSTDESSSRGDKKAKLST